MLLWGYLAGFFRAFFASFFRTTGTLQASRDFFTAFFVSLSRTSLHNYSGLRQGPWLQASSRLLCRSLQDFFTAFVASLFRATLQASSGLLQDFFRAVAAGFFETALQALAGLLHGLCCKLVQGCFAGLLQDFFRCKLLQDYLAGTFIASLAPLLQACSVHFAGMFRASSRPVLQASSRVLCRLLQGLCCRLVQDYFPLLATPDALFNPHLPPPLPSPSVMFTSDPFRPAPRPHCCPHQTSGFLGM
jgi:hypothetical protein